MDFVAFCQALLCLLYYIVSSYFLLLFWPASAVYPYLRILLPFASYYNLLLLRLYLHRLTLKEEIRMTEKTYGYVCVSTKGQKEDQQLDAILEFGIPNHDHIDEAYIISRMEGTPTPPP